MTQDEINQMVEQAGFNGMLSIGVVMDSKQIKAFAKLVAAKAIAELESQKPVAWLLTEKNINSLQVDSIQLLINRLKHAHHTDLCVRINGQDEWFQADWLKHMVRATPPQRTWIGLTEQERNDIEDYCEMMIGKPAFDDIEAKLKEKNT